MSNLDVRNESESAKQDSGRISPQDLNEDHERVKFCTEHFSAQYSEITKNLDSYGPEYVGFEHP